MHVRVRLRYAMLYVCTMHTDVYRICMGDMYVMWYVCMCDVYVTCMHKQGYSWIDALKAMAHEKVSDNQLMHATSRFHDNTVCVNEKIHSDYVYYLSPHFFFVFNRSSAVSLFSSYFSYCFTNSFLPFIVYMCNGVCVCIRMYAYVPCMYVCILYVCIASNQRSVFVSLSL